MLALTPAYLADLAEIVGRGITPRYLETDGVRVVNQRCIRDGRLDLTPSRRHNHLTHPVTPRKYLHTGDTLINSTGVGTLGRTAHVNHIEEPTTADSHVTIVRPRTEVNSRWLGYALRSLEHDIEGLAEGSTGQTELSQSSLAGLVLRVPARAHQDLTADILSALDDKIAANQRVVTAADRLRSDLWNRLTQGAPQVPLSSIARFVNGKAFTKDATGTGRVVIRIAEINGGIGASTVYNDLAVADDNVAYPGDLLMAWSGSLTSARWFRSEAIINQHIFKVVPISDHPIWAVACAVDTKMPAFKSIAATKATTMGHIQRHHLDEPVHWPALDDATRQVGDVLWNRALRAERESEQLAATRDELLPLLMSGRITVKDAERRVDEEI